MFPARPIVKLDDGEIMDCLKNVHDNEIIGSLGGIRIVGFFRQAECLTAYALDMFKDLTLMTDVLISRFDTLRQKVEELKSELPSAISAMKETAEQWGQMDDIPANAHESQDDGSQFQFQRSTIVNAVVNEAEAPPDLSPFSVLEKEINQNDVDFNRFFSDPDFFKRQYVQEVLEQLQKEKEMKKKAQREAKQKEKDAKKMRSELKQKSEAAGEGATEDIISAIAAPPIAPRSLSMPPPRGQAKHGEVPVSLLHGTQPLTTSYKPSAISSRPMAPKARARPPPSNYSSAPVETSSTPASSGAPPPPPPPPPPSSSTSTGFKFKTGGATDLSSISLKSVDSEQDTSSVSHLDLIKSGKFVLKAVDKSKPLPPLKPKIEERDPNTLSVQEILQQAAKIRDAVACSDSSSEESSSESSSTTW